MIRLALIGLGKMGRRWLDKIRESDRFDLVAVVDSAAVPPDSTQLPVSEFPAEFCRRVEYAPSFGAAIIATPDGTHASIAAEVMRRGAYALIEKPLATDAAACEILRATAEVYGVRHAVGHIERFNPAIQAIRSAIRAGRIGEARNIVTARICGPPPEPRDIVLDLAVHDLDLVRHLAPGAGEWRVWSARLSGNPAAEAIIGLRSASGMTAVVSVSYRRDLFPEASDGARTVRVEGTLGHVFADMGSGARDAGLMLKRSPGQWIPIQTLATDPLAAQLDAFADLCEGKDPGPLCLAADGAEAVALAERALEMGRCAR